MASSSDKKQTKYQHVWVCARIRPCNERSENTAFSSISSKELTTKGNKNFRFDRIFDQASLQADVYKNVVGRLVDDVLKGYRCTVLAYGQTGSGKTYTMIGDMPENTEMDWRVDSKVGCITRAAMHIFEELGKKDPAKVQYTVMCSFMEIYNEEVRDLLTDKECTPLKVYEDKKKQNHVHNLSEVTVLTPRDLYDLLRKGCAKRQTASTLMNRDSSRSHTVFTITVNLMETGASFTNGKSNILCGKLHLVDLAGSENVAKSGAKELRAREAGTINQSLLTLGRVIKALAGNSSHVPYRESKLTRILMDSLGGSSKTSIIATVSPSMRELDETLNTLEYAQGARNITNCPIINTTASSVIQNLQEEIIQLKRDLFSNMHNEGIYLDAENYEEMMRNIEENRKAIASQSKHIKEMSENLEQAQMELERMEVLEASFKNTKKMIEEQTNLLKNKDQIINYYEKKAQIFQKQANEFKTLTDRITDNESKLHRKIQTIYNISGENQMYLTTMLENMFNFIEKTDVANEHLKEEFQQQIEEFRRFINGQKKAQQNIHAELLDKASYYEYHSNSIGLETVDEASTTLEKLNNGLVAMKDDDYIELNSAITNLKKLEESIKQKDSLMSNWIENSEKGKEAFKKHFLRLIKKTEKIEQSIESLEGDLNEPQKRLGNRVDQAKASMAEHIERMVQQLKRNMQDTMEQTLNSLTEENYADCLKERIDVIVENSNLKPNLAELEDAIYKNVDNHANCLTTLKRSCDRELENVAMLAKNVESISEQGKEKMLLCEEVVTNLRDHLKEIKTEKEQMAEAITTLGEIADINSTQIEQSLKDSVENNVASISEPLAAMREILQQNQENIKPIKSQGDTPVRQSHSYPRRVHSLAPQASLLSNLQRGETVECENLEDSFTETNNFSS